ncbi:hypothetical protein TELCIR_26246 [Teladorsagia circumcincta]|uniref:Uncharacterized protein n=1 Tax=Teladorsagia circumcincta TaxID=45464 RepID=A0A2G9T3H3_TELCI|nr:hypothetical protein TELCIR_26246 [Teladorsagia circumcincta]
MSGSSFMSTVTLLLPIFLRPAFMKSVYEAVRPVIPCVMLFAVSISWAVFSRTDVCGTDPRTFFFAMGTVFSNIAVSFEHFCSLQVHTS